MQENLLKTTCNEVLTLYPSVNDRYVYSRDLGQKITPFFQAINFAMNFMMGIVGTDFSFTLPGFSELCGTNRKAERSAGRTVNQKLNLCELKRNDEKNCHLTAIQINSGGDHQLPIHLLGLDSQKMLGLAEKNWLKLKARRKSKTENSISNNWRTGAEEVTLETQWKEAPLAAKRKQVLPKLRDRRWRSANKSEMNCGTTAVLIVSEKVFFYLVQEISWISVDILGLSTVERF